mgnify:CR=1 FL=1
MRGPIATTLAGVLALALAGCGGGTTTVADTRADTARLDPCAGAPADAGFVFVSVPRPGDPVASGFTLLGCARSFEGNVPWRLLDAGGRVIARGAATGGSVDGPAPFSARVAYAVGEAQVGMLEVSEDDPSGGEGRPPVRNVIPVQLAATGP